MCINKLGNIYTDTMHSSLLTLQISINIPHLTLSGSGAGGGGGGGGMPATKSCASCEAMAS